MKAEKGKLYFDPDGKIFTCVAVDTEDVELRADELTVMVSPSDFAKFFRTTDQIYSASEREQQLVEMRRISNAFYGMAFQLGCHPFIEFCGFMNEFIKIAHRAHDQGIDFNSTTGHGGGGPTLPIKPFEAAYIGEKFNCIFGPSLLADPELRAQFLSKSLPE